MTLETTELPFITRVIVPQRRGYRINRRRLLDAVKAGTSKKVQVFTGPAGYGKTSLLAQLVEEATLPVCWYSFAPEDADPSLFLRYCIQSARNEIPGFGEGYASLSPVGHHGEWRTELGFFINALQSDVAGRLIFVFDDVHWIQGKREMEDVLALLIERAPPNVHFALGSRAWPSLSCLPKLAAGDDLHCTGAADLCFSSEETAELLGQLWEREVTAHEAGEINQKTRGWPAAVMLTARNETAASLPDLARAGDEGILFEYLSHEIFDRLPQLLKHFLLRTSVLREFTPALCSRLLDVDDGQSIIDHIRDLGLFLEERVGNGSVYAFHDLFRGFLESRFRSDSPDEHRRMHYSAGVLFSELGDDDAAIYHFTESGNNVEAISLVKSVAGSYYAQGRWQKLDSLLRRLPRHALSADPELVLLSGQLLIRLGNPTESLAVLDTLTEEGAHQSPQVLGNALVAKSTAYRRLGHLERAVAAAEEGLAVLRGTDCSQEFLAEGYKQLGDAFFTQGNYELAKQNLHLALDLTSKGNLRLFSLISNDLGVVYMELGGLDQAAMFLEQSKAGLVRLGSEGPLAETLNNLSLVYYHRGEFDLALDEVRKAVTTAQAAEYPRVLATGLMNQAIAQRAVGAYTNSLESASRALELSRQLLDQRLIAESTNALGNAYRKLGETSKAEVLLKQALLEVENSGQDYIAAIYNISLGKVYCQLGNYDQALEHLSAAANQLAELNSLRRVAEARVYQAAAFYRTGKLKEALSCLTQAAELGSTESFDGYLLADGEELMDVLRFAAAKRVGGETFVRLVARIGADQPPVEPSDQSNGKSASASHFPTLRAFSFGISRVFLDTHEVTGGEWRSKKARELFFYLLAKKQVVPGDQIVESLWPELSLDLSESTLKTNVYRLRQALFPDCILSQGPGYSINPNVPIEFDLDDFQHSLRQASATQSSNDEREEHLSRAVALHEGPFLGECYSEWCEQLRTGLEVKYHAALMGLAAYRSARRDFHQAIELLEKVIEADPYNEEAQYQYIQNYVSCNEPFTALQHLRKFAKLSVEELGADLPARFHDCHKQILQLIPEALPAQR